jgi:transglutaminase-like putative cysteine protease
MGAAALMGIGFNGESTFKTGMRRVRSKARRKTRKNKNILAFAIVVLIIVAAASAFLLIPKNSNDEPEGLRTLADHYTMLMKNLNSTQTKASMRAQLNANYNQTDLFTWEHSKMTFGTDQMGFFEDPLQILGRGQGICVQWSVVYVSACLSLGYPSRLVVAVDTTTWTYIHTWAEDNVNGKWVHVDPSDSVWNNPSIYQGVNWPWGSGLGSWVRVYAFEDGSYQDVTATYAKVKA